MSKTTDKIVYWITLAGPIYDAIKGVVLGLISAYKSVKAEREALDLQMKEQKMREQFNKDNLGV